MINTDLFAAWFVVTGDATPDGIRVVRSVLGAISSLSIAQQIRDLRGKAATLVHPQGYLAHKNPPPPRITIGPKA